MKQINKLMMKIQLNKSDGEKIIYNKIKKLNKMYLL